MCLDIEVTAIVSDITNAGYVLEVSGYRDIREFGIG